MLKVLFILIILSLYTMPVNAHSLSGDVKLLKIIDGDTVEIQLKETSAKFRLAGIDCFETSKNYRAYKQAYLNKMGINEVIFKGCMAKSHLNNMLYGIKNVKTKIVGIDKYGRLLGVIYGKDNLNINQALLNHGICPSYVYKK